MYVFVDDSGDPGFKFGKGSSNYLVYSAFKFHTAEEVAQVSSYIQQTKTKHGLNRKVELKFTKSKPALRGKFLTHIGEWKLVSSSIVLDKRRIRPTSAIDLQVMMLSELLIKSGLNLVSAKVFLDGQGSRNSIHRIQRGLNLLDIGPIRQIKEVKFAHYLTRLLASKGTHTVRRLFGDESR